MNELPLYNSRIFKSYEEYIKKYFSRIDIESLLNMPR
jgi:hypothetical protein